MTKVSLVCSLFMTITSVSYNLAGGVIVTQDFLDVHNLDGPEHTSLLGELDVSVLIKKEQIVDSGRYCRCNLRHRLFLRSCLGRVAR